MSIVVKRTRCVIQNNSIRISKDGMTENWYYGAGMYVEKKASVTIRETSMLLNFANTQAGNTNLDETQTGSTGADLLTSQTVALESAAKHKSERIEQGHHSNTNE